MRPSSSQTTAKIKSFWASGRYKNFCRPLPSPRPVTPPEPMAIRDWMACIPLSRGSSQGFSHVVIREVM